MDWRFWKTVKRLEEARDWPTDTHESIRQLLSMYQGAGIPPFASWAAPGIAFTPDVEPTARNGVKGYQLALWFWLFAEARHYRGEDGTRNFLPACRRGAAVVGTHH